MAEKMSAKDMDKIKADYAEVSRAAIARAKGIADFGKSKAAPKPVGPKKVGPKVVGPKKVGPKMVGPKLDMANVKKQDALLSRAAMPGAKLSADENRAVAQIRAARSFRGTANTPAYGPKIMGPKKVGAKIVGPKKVGPKIVGPKKAPKGMK